MSQVLPLSLALAGVAWLSRARTWERLLGASCCVVTFLVTGWVTAAAALMVAAVIGVTWWSPRPRWSLPVGVTALLVSGAGVVWP